MRVILDVEEMDEGLASIIPEVEELALEATDMIVVALDGDGEMRILSAVGDLDFYRMAGILTQAQRVVQEAASR